MEKEIKEFLQKEFKVEAEEILKEVEQDAEIAEMKAPPEMEDNLFAQIQEEQKSTDETEELIRLGRIYQKKIKKRKYLVLAAALVALFVFGITSLGGAERLLEGFQWKVGDREQVTMNSDDMEMSEVRLSEEEEAYQRIKDEFGFDPVRLDYLTEGMQFQEANFFEEMHSVQMVYQNVESSSSFIYCIKAHYRDSSVSMDVEDEIISDYVLKIGSVDVQIKRYKIKDSSFEKMTAVFNCDKIQYFLAGYGIQEKEFIKIIENLHFF